MPTTSEKTCSAQLACPECDSNRFELDTQTQTFSYGPVGSQVQLEAAVPVWKCLNCGFEFTDESGEIARHDAVCRHLGVLSPRDIVHLREVLKISQAELAAITGFGEASIKRWEAGLVIQNTANDNLLRLMDDPRVVMRLRNLERQRTLGEPADENVVSIERRFRTALPEDTFLRSRSFHLRSSSGS